MLLLACLAPANAGAVFASVGEELSFDLNGTWARIHPAESGWKYFQGAGGDYWVEDLADDLSGFDSRDRTQLTDNGTLQDTQVERCDDGGWLILGSATIDTFDDSAYAWRWDADFTNVQKLTIEEREESRAHNDMAVLCDDVATGVAYANGRSGGTSTFFDIDGGTLGDSHTIDAYLMGGSLAVRPSDGRIVSADIGGPDAPEIRIHVFDPDWSVVEETSFAVPEGRALWPQRLQPFGDGWLIVWLGRDGDGGGTEGEVWLGALDADFQLVDSVRVSPDGVVTNGRPWFGRKGNAVAVSYDREVQPHAVLVQLQDGAVPPDDDGLPDTGPDEGADDTAGDAVGGTPPTCGCGTGTGAGLATIAIGALVAGFRRSKRPSPPEGGRGCPKGG